MSKKDDWPKEKSWKMLPTRSQKLGRAKQLRDEYPKSSSVSNEGKVSQEKVRVLFVCSRNQWRSPTAERIWSRHPQVAARSGGTSPNAKHPVTESDIRWADVIIVMEQKHKSRLVAAFPRLLEHKPLHVLEIPDDYKFMDAGLIEELEACVPPLLGIEES